MSNDLKKRFLELLERDMEFRYAVAGYLGILETLKRLDAMEAEIKKLWEEVKALRENQEGPWQKAERAKRVREAGKQNSFGSRRSWGQNVRVDTRGGSTLRNSEP